MVNFWNFVRYSLEDNIFLLSPLGIFSVWQRTEGIVRSFVWLVSASEVLGWACTITSRLLHCFFCFLVTFSELSFSELAGVVWVRSSLGQSLDTLQFRKAKDEVDF